MINLMINSSMILLISFILMLTASIISKKTFKDREKNSPFECGFNPLNSSRLPFSLQFFLIAVIFLIFDVEITLLLPMIPFILMSNMKFWFITSSTFIIILIIGIFHEWTQGAINWSS